MRRFTLVRNEDISGVSGTGVVAEGVEFHDKQVAVSWFGRYHTIVVAPNISTIEAIHGHGGLTRVEWQDEEDVTWDSSNDSSVNP
jgi:hypothetical protein